MEELKKAKGQFARFLLRNNKTIKEDRALTILRRAELAYKRQVEDIESELQDLEAERKGLLDLSPTNADSLILATDFKPEQFYTTDMRLTLKIRETKIRLEEARTRFKELFEAPVVEVEEVQ